MKPIFLTSMLDIRERNNVTYYYSEGGCIVGKYLHEKGYRETY